MMELVSTLSGQFSKALILGTLFPALLFVLSILLFVFPLLPYPWAQLPALETVNAQWLVAVALGVILLSAVLYNLNVPIIRFYEGYPWLDSWLGRLLTDRRKAEYEAAHARWSGMRTLIYALPGSPLKEYLPDVQKKWVEYGLEVNHSLPLRQSGVLPTRLGNVIRSFENYPERQYRIEAISMWPRLLAKMDKEYAAALSEAKVSFDFMINCSLLSAALSLLLLVAGLLYPVPLISPSLSLPWALRVILFAYLAYLFYRLSIGRAAAWGALVKSAFDLFRHDLLKQLGFGTVPENLREEREMWQDISNQTIYGDSPRVRPAEYQSAVTYARGEPYTAAVETTRGVSGPSVEGVVVVTLKARNLDSRAVRAVVIRDKLPPGYDYEWGSVDGRGRVVEVAGVNPYEFRVGDMAAHESVVFSYRAVFRQKWSGGN